MTAASKVRRIVLSLLCTLLFLAGGLLAAWWLLQDRKAPEPKPDDKPPAPVTAVAAGKNSIGEWTELLGTTQPLPGSAGRISARVEGLVVSVLRDDRGAVLAEGDPVKFGQVLVQLDARVARANREKLAATLLELDEQKKQAQYAVELADLEVKRLEELRKSATDPGALPLVSRVELARARINLKDAESKQLALPPRQASINADLRALDAQLEFYTLRSPIAGQIGLVQVLPGQNVAPGTTVAEVLNLDEIDVLCFVPPQSAARLQLKQPSRLAGAKVPAGKVVFIALQAQPDTGNFAVKVRFPNKELGLRANLVQRIQVLTQPEIERLTINEDALMEDQTPPAVVVAEEVKKEGEAGKEEGEAGKEEKVYKARKLRAIVGVRDRERKLVELLRLEDLETHEEVAVGDLLFVTRGAQGLQDDLLKLEDAKEEKKEEK